MSPSAAPAWYRQAAAAAASDALLKAIGTMACLALFFAAYFYVLRHPAFAPTVLPLTRVDRWIGFHPLALPLYVSLWVYVSLVPAFMPSRAALYRYAIAMISMCAIGLAIFYAWPTAVPAPAADWQHDRGLRLLKDIDATGNACPSLHVAAAVLSAVWSHRVLRSFDAPRWLLAGTWVWCAAIVYSTLALRQHVALDAAAGLALGALTAWLSVRDQKANISASRA
jgi:membrane-associated phospholipid phosphatase